MRAAIASLLLISTPAGPAAAQNPAPAAQAPDEAALARADALSLEAMINDVYAYPERLPGGRYALTPRLRAEAERVADRRSLLRFTERALMLLADHHAITGSSFGNSYAVVPTFADLWIEAWGDRYLIESVRRGSPAEAAGIKAGESLVAIGELPTAQAVRAFWEDLGTEPFGDRSGFAARVLAAAGGMPRGGSRSKDGPAVGAWTCPASTPLGARTARRSRPAERERHS